jgi:hypothetical protein
MRIVPVPPNGDVLLKNEITLFELFSVIGIVVAIVSFAISVSVAHTSASTTKAEFSFRLWQAFMEADVQHAYHEIEWGHFRYSEDTPTGFSDKEQEYRIDKLLYLFDDIALQIDAGILSKKHSGKWYYHGRRIFRNEEVVKYILFLDRFFEQNGVPKQYKLSRRLFG